MSVIESVLRLFAPPPIAEVPVAFSRLPAYRAEYFPDSGPKPWLDRDDWAERIEGIDADRAELCRDWAEKGYVILPKLFSDSVLDQAWQDYEDAWKQGKIVLPPEPAGEGDTLPGRLLNPHHKLPQFGKVARSGLLLEVLDMMLGRRVKLLQTIASHKGSQQAAHSDSIHMTTYPLGYLAAAWIAFEDIHEDSGPLEYYPGSHKLPYIFSHDLGISVDDMKRDGYTTYRERYEPMVGAQVAVSMVV